MIRKATAPSDRPSPNLRNTGYSATAMPGAASAAMKTSSTPVATWPWWAAASPREPESVTGARNGPLSRLAAVATMNSTPATTAFTLEESAELPALDKLLGCPIGDWHLNHLLFQKWWGCHDGNSAAPQTRCGGG